MDQGPLVNEQIVAGAQFACEFNHYATLSATFWLKKSDDGEWYLYLVSDQINDSNITLAYGEVVRIYQSSPHPWLDLFQIKVAGSDKPLARAIIELQQQYPARPLRQRTCRLGGVFIEEVYIYPIPALAAA